MATVFSKELERLRASAGISKRQLAKQSHYSESYVNKLCQGTCKPPPADAVRKIVSELTDDDSLVIYMMQLAQQERLSPEAREFIRLREHDAPRPEITVSLPVFGSVPAGPPEECRRQAEGEHTVLKHLGGKGRFVLRILGTSLYPTLRPNDLVVAEALEAADPRALNGRIVVALLNGGSTIKYLHCNRGKITLAGDRGDVPPIRVRKGDELVIQAVVHDLVHRELSKPEY